MRIFLFILLFLPVSFLEASTYISEIMYDPLGTDGKREWVEVYSDDYSDISDIKLRENDVNHSLKLYQEGENNNYFVIADNPEEFLNDNPDFSGYLYDSAFSLNNSGELISIIYNGVILDEVSYSSSLGANGTGNSLQKSNDVFIASIPTPGKENSNSAVNENEDQEEDDVKKEEMFPHSNYVEISEFSPDTIEIGIGRERLVPINTPIYFEVLSKDRLKGKFNWSLGDGRSIKGKKVSFKYKREGHYNVFLNLKIGNSYAVSRTSVMVFEPKIELETLNGEVFIKNISDYELNIGGFELISGNNKFVFPQDTVISLGNEIVLDEEVLGFVPEKVKIYYPKSEQPVEKLDQLDEITNKTNTL